jgi:hypothetical protein
LEENSGESGIEHERPKIKEQRQTVQEESGTPGKESGKEQEQSESLACYIKGRERKSGFSNTTGVYCGS